MTTGHWVRCFCAALKDLHIVPPISALSLTRSLVVARSLWWPVLGMCPTHCCLGSNCWAAQKWRKSTIAKVESLITSKMGARALVVLPTHCLGSRLYFKRARKSNLKQTSPDPWTDGPRLGWPGVSRFRYFVFLILFVYFLCWDAKKSNYCHNWGLCLFVWPINSRRCFCWVQSEIGDRFNSI